jgi:hypothetical protein
MPVTRPAYGRKPGPFVTAPDFNAKKATDKAKAEKAARDAAVAITVITTSVG